MIVTKFHGITYIYCMFPTPTATTSNILGWPSWVASFSTTVGLDLLLGEFGHPSGNPALTPSHHGSLRNSAQAHGSNYRMSQRFSEYSNNLFKVSFTRFSSLAKPVSRQVILWFVTSDWFSLYLHLKSVGCYGYVQGPKETPWISHLSNAWVQLREAN